MRPATKRVIAALLSALVVGAGADAAATDAPASDQAASDQAASERRADAPASYRHLKARVYRSPGLGTIAVGAPDPKHVMVQNLDEATFTWSAPRLLFRGANRVTCGDISGRASAGGVALLLECDTPYYEDQAPASSVALVTQDLRTWSKRELPGEAYRPPAISPNGSYAAWLAGGSGDFVEWGASEGFLPLRRSSFNYDSGGETLVVTDDGTVTVLGPESPGEACVVGVHERTLSGEISSSQVEGVDPGCTEGSLENRGAFEVVGGGSERSARFVIRRADAGSPWLLSSRAPDTAPGLVAYEGSPHRAIHTSFSDVAGQPLVAYGSPDRRRVFTQRYDEDAQEWAPRELRYEHRFPGCTAESTFGQQRLRVHAISLHCYLVERADGDYPPYTDGYQAAPPRLARMLVSSDGTAWQVIDIAGRPLGTSADRSLLAVPAAQSTKIVSPDGIVGLHVRAPAPCGFVFPIAPDAVVRLHGGPKGWPRVLQRYDGDTWRTIQRVRLPREGTCTRVRAFDDFSPSTYLLTGGRRTIALKVVRKDGGWRVVRTSTF
ncbi:hypothetical protein NPS01_22300 [Nocardioides psychrotolerans]|uniref:WD40-like Beta Propeller Repeat n=1 Tax=Nocardioides psychrotolerans TaxID=1005945 RepID=A0A1I3KTB0_9ACTN|nr:hypothetical protein [Nocardioides psychrotolerans]GEP38567.1 hypothetical protein NPS01_22300 [Nocardioides psychrotolerans]SFI75733.1 hypothetical protein SAMN05216561_112138 [Nocardioides psychrotolerans]